MLTHSPKQVFAGMAIAAHAIGARHGILYRRAEYVYLRDYLARQLVELRADGGGCSMSACPEPHCVTLGLFDNPTSLIIRPRPRARLRRTYQLSLEDADLISRYTRVSFVDATKDPAVEIVHPEPSGAEAGLQLYLARNLSAVNPGDHPAVLRTPPRGLLAGDPRLRRNFSRD